MDITLAQTLWQPCSVTYGEEVGEAEEPLSKQAVTISLGAVVRDSIPSAVVA
eukprot:SAG11_NODE_9554_length_900_cov_0.861596_2_plen_51_part_01